MNLYQTNGLLVISIALSCLACTSQTGHFRDLNKNGKMDVYEDSTQSIDKRVEDLLSQMNLEEKAGMMFINGTMINENGTIEKDTASKGFAAMIPSCKTLINEKKMNHFNYWQAPAPKQMAIGYNAIQKLAENTRLGIPVTISSDPRHYFSAQIFAMTAKEFSMFPEQLGFAAIGDEKLMHEFGDIARQEYLAVGIREALHPMADLATEPRWPRISGTFGEDAYLSAKLISAYIKGFQGGDSLTKEGVACMTKHFPGGGPQKEGLDPHFPIQKGQVYPGNNFAYHLIPFEAAIKAKTASIMPYYGVPTNQTSENVAMSFNKDIITKMLREKYHYEGVICTDWGLITDTHMGNAIWPARAWGVEKLSEKERVKKAIEAGVDQFGGENCPEYIVQLVKEGAITEKRIDESVRRLLKMKFELGLFENPYVEADKTDQIVGKAEWKALGKQTQRRSFTLLKNDQKTLPIPTGTFKIYIRNIDSAVASKYGIIVKKPEEADYAIIRINTPWYAVNTNIPLAKTFHHGDLDFKGKEKNDILNLCSTAPTIVDIYIDRPAVIPEINAKARALLANYGADDEALLDVIFGKAKPEGKLPFELPSGMDAVRNQKEDLPYDSKNPLYKHGFGLSY